MFQFDNFIFFDEVVSITFLFVYILLYVKFFSYFFKSRIFLAVFSNIQKFSLHLKILLQSKILGLSIVIKPLFIIMQKLLFNNYMFTSKMVYKIYFIYKNLQIKSIILKLLTLCILLYMIKQQQLVYTKISMNIIKILCCIDLFNLFLFFFVLLCVYLGYNKTKKEQKISLHLEFGNLYAFFYFFLQGYFCVNFFLLYPLYIIGVFSFTYFFKYLENLYYNKLSKLNLLLAFFVWIMLSILGVTNKF